MFSDDAELVSLFDIDVLEGEHQAAYNQAPSQLIRAVTAKVPREELGEGDAGAVPHSQTPGDQGERGGEIEGEGEARAVAASETRRLGLQQWGFVPSWAKEGFRPLINARSETVTSKPVFRGAASRRRCLVPTNGYFEWRKMPDGKKQPYFFSLADREGRAAPVGSEPIMAMAGIWEYSEEGAPTVALLTRAASEPLAFIHNRMPLFVPSSLWGAWMDPGLVDKETVAELIRELPPPPLIPRMVRPAVGNARNNFPGLIDPYDPAVSALDSSGRAASALDSSGRAPASALDPNLGGANGVAGGQGVLPLDGL